MDKARRNRVIWAGKLGKAVGQGIVALAAFAQLVDLCQGNDACRETVSPALMRLSPCVQLIGEWGWLLRRAGLLALVLLVAWRFRELLGRVFVSLLYVISPQGFDWLLRSMSGFERAAQGERELGIREWERILPALNEEALEMVAVVFATYDPLSEDDWIQVMEETPVLTLGGNGSIVAQRRKITVACEELVGSGLVSEWEMGSAGLPRVRMHMGFGPAIFLTVRGLIERELTRRNLRYKWTYDWGAE